MSDCQRNKNIYRYLFYLAVVYKKNSNQEIDNISHINLTQTAKRLGYGEKVDEVKKIYYLIHENQEKKYLEPEILTTAILIERLTAILSSLEEELKDPRTTVENPKKIKKEDIIQLFSHLITLSPAETEALGLTTGEANIILQQSLLNLERYQQTPEQRDAILQLYKSSIDLNQDNINTSDFLSNNEKLQIFIKEMTEKYFNNLGLKRWIGKSKKVEELCRKIARHIRRIESQIGIGELATLDPSLSQKLPINHLNSKFIKRLIDSTIENNLIRDSIPLYFQYITTQQLKPLPLYYPEPQNGYHDGLLNPNIKALDNNNDNTSLSSQYVYKVTISFNLKIENKELENIKKHLPEEAKARLIKEGKGGLVFSVSSSGVGGQLSQMLKVINRALLWDINCLRKHYFPIAHDLVIYQDVIKNNVASPVWAHSLVRLCRVDYLEKALSEKKLYDECVLIDEVATGDYCGFNFFESVAKSAIQARLSAILKTQIRPEQYIKDLSQTIQQEEIVKIAEDYLNYYPFSLSAMESYLQCHLFKERDCNSYVYINARLAIVKAYLREGLYRKAYTYLKELKEKLEISRENPQILSGETLAKYELCKANYFYLCNEQETDNNYQWSGLPRYDRATFIRYSWESLIKAESHLTKRLTKYVAIQEISQSTLHPYFITLARINFVKAKLFLFFPSYAETKVNEKDDLRNYHYARFYFLERSRIYAAKNGNTVDYACYTAYQAFAYIVTGYFVNSKLSLISNREVDFTRENCLKWAKKLRDNALINYAEFGQECYYQIKEKSGIIANKIYGEYKIESLPLIREENEFLTPDQPLIQGWQDGILHIDMSLLHMRTLDNSDDLLDKSIYLFGAKVAIILFARAMYELCSDENIESILEWKTKIRKAYRLFSYAWAIAEDGCITEKVEHDDYGYRITRPHFNSKTQLEDYPFPEAQSVRDLYPHRQSEIADLGKVFAIACHLHSLYLTESLEEKEQIKREIKHLKLKFQDTSRTKLEHIENQPTFNAHLLPYFNKVQSIIDEQVNRANCNKHIPDKTGINNIRNKIMNQFFDFYNLVMQST